MRLRLKRRPRRPSAPLSTSDLLPPVTDNAGAAELPTGPQESSSRTVGPRLSSRDFFKVVGASVGLALASQVIAPPTPAFASTDTILQCELYGPSSSDQETAGVLILNGQLVSSTEVTAVQFYVQKPSGGSGGTEALRITTAGNVVLPVGSLTLQGGGGLNTPWIGGTQIHGTVDMGNQSIVNANYIWGFANQPLKLYGGQDIWLNQGNGQGSFK